MRSAHKLHKMKVILVRPQVSSLEMLDRWLYKSGKDVETRLPILDISL